MELHASGIHAESFTGGSWTACNVLPQVFRGTCMSALNSVHAFDSWIAGSTAGYFIRLYGAFYIVCILASLWVFFVARKLAPGLPRVLACLPVVVVQLGATPLLVDRTLTPVLIVPVMGIFSLAAFKVAAFALGRGPLALPNCPWLDELPRFGAVLSFPVIPKAVFKISKGTTADALTSSAPTTPATFGYTYCCKAGGATIAATLAVWPVLPQLLRHWFYALCLSLSLGAIWDFWCLMVVMWFGVDVAPSFDKPWLSISFADYWSRRWNLTTTYMLRVLIYEPIMEGSLVPAAAVAANTAVKAAATTAQALQDAEKSKAVSAAAAAPAGPVSSDGDTSDNESVSSSHNTAAAAAGQKSKDSMQAIDDKAMQISASIASTGLQATAVVSDSSGSTDTQGAEAGAALSTKSTAAEKKKLLLRRVVALHATFAFSGLWHMLIFYYATGLVTYHWLVFFSVQAPIMTAEAVLVKWAKGKGLLLRRPIAIFLTNFLLIVVANPLFFGPCDWSGMCTAMMDNVKGYFV